MTITSDIKVANNGITASQNPQYMFLAPSIIENELEKFNVQCPLFIGENSPDKYMLVTTNPFTLMNGNFETLDMPATPIASTTNGKYFLLTHNGKYGVMDNNGTYVLPCTHHFSGFLDVIILEDASGKKVINQNGLIRKTKNEIIRTFSNGYFIEEIEGREKVFLLMNELGVCISTSNDLEELSTEARAFNSNQSANHNDNIHLFEKLIIKRLKREIPELQDRPEDTIRDLAAYASSIGLNLFIDLRSLRVYKVKFEKCLKLTEDGKSIWFPDTEDSIAKLKEFVRKRKNNGGKNA